jgi:hypothetical protein
MSFSEHQYQLLYSEGYEGYFWHRARMKIVFDALRRYANSADVVMEIGCGRGLYVAEARRRGYEAYGCELGNPIVEPLAADYIFTGKDVRDLDRGLLYRVSVVLLLDVIEHIENTTELFDGIIAALPSLRVILVAVPARKELWSNWDEFYGHYRRYTRPELNRALTLSGFIPAKIGYFFHALYIPMWLLSQLNVTRAVSIEKPSSPLLHRLLGAFCAYESRWLPSSLVGTSLLGVSIRTTKG